MKQNMKWTLLLLALICCGTVHAGQVRPTDSISSGPLEVVLTDGTTRLPDSLRVVVTMGKTETFDAWLNSGDASVTVLNTNYLLFGDLWSNLDGAGVEGPYNVTIDAYHDSAGTAYAYKFGYEVGTTFDQATATQIDNIEADTDTLKNSAYDIMMLIESQRRGHTYHGSIFYVDPVNGGTHAGGNRGGKDDPYSTVQDCHDNAITANNHDLIILVPGNPSGVTTLTEDVTLSKEYTFIRGPGRDFIWTRSGGGNTIMVTADGMELSGFQLNTAATGSGNGIDITDADFIRVEHVWINNTRGDGIYILRGNNCQIIENVFTNTGQSGSGQALEIVGTSGTSSNNLIRGNYFKDCTGDAIQVTAGTIDNTVVIDNIIEGSTGYGVQLGANSVEAVVASNHFGNNTLGPIDDGGTLTVLLNNEQWAQGTIQTSIQADVVNLDGFNLSTTAVVLPDSSAADLSYVANNPDDYKGSSALDDSTLGDVSYTANNPGDFMANVSGNATAAALATVLAEVVNVDGFNFTTTAVTATDTTETGRTIASKADVIYWVGLYLTMYPNCKVYYMPGSDYDDIIVVDTLGDTTVTQRHWHPGGTADDPPDTTSAVGP